MMVTSEEIYRRLRKGQSLHHLGLHEVDGRWLIDRLQVPLPQATGNEFRVGGLVYDFLANVQHIKRRKWANLHFRDCGLQELAFSRCQLANIIFEKCDCRKMGFWWSTVRDSQFIECDMRNVALGGNNVLRPRNPNEFHDVSFVNCDMRQTGYTCELFQGCLFENCKFSDEDFFGSRFVDCVFVGNLKDVTFRKRNDDCKKVEDNTLRGCDFTRADYSVCQFIKINLEKHMFESNSDVIWLARGPVDWSKWLNRLSEPSEGQRWLVGELVRIAGTPSMISRKYMLDLFTKEEVSILEKLGSE